jgi:hypothetical protein
VWEVSEDSGAVWRLDLSTGSATQLIADSAKFAVVMDGPNAGSIVADQKTMTSDPTGEKYPAYPFFLFSSTGEKIRQIGEDAEDLSGVVNTVTQ